jgi:hypothetical protein
VLATVIFVVGYAKHKAKDEHGVSGSAKSIAEKVQRDSEKYLAYIHSLGVKVEKSTLEKKYESVISACADDRKNKCTILDSNSYTGNYVSATIRLRILPQGVENIVAVASANANITSQSTKVEDLAKTIIDTDKRIAMLTDYRDRLIALEGKAGNDIDALIKVSLELAKTQSNLEKATGESAYLLQRVNMDIISISFNEQHSLSFWDPIAGGQ